MDNFPTLFMWALLDLMVTMIDVVVVVVKETHNHRTDAIGNQSQKPVNHLLWMETVDSEWADRKLMPPGLLLL